ncbi:hypothetical protein [Lysobacter sp. CA199]|uniref:hypothetical protein n=1 Tax=Lysobacter sp. CA199 TaxID=3455608 RepID=UPI003F8D77FC
MSKLSFAALIAAVCVLSFSANAVERPSAPAQVTGLSDIFNPLPKPCPIGKTETVIYDKQGRPVGRVCV